MHIPSRNTWIVCLLLVACADPVTDQSQDPGTGAGQNTAMNPVQGSTGEPSGSSGTSGGSGSASGGASSTTGAGASSNGIGDSPSELEDAGSPAAILAADDAKTPGHDATDVVSCGAKTPVCDLARQTCCVTGFGGDTASCHDGATCPTGKPTACDGPEECDRGTVCCVVASQGQNVCKATCGAFAAFEFQMCHVDADCPAGLSCAQSKTFTWWGTCS